MVVISGSPSISGFNEPRNDVTCGLFFHFFGKIRSVLEMLHKWVRFLTLLYISRSPVCTGGSVNLHHWVYSWHDSDLVSSNMNKWIIVDQTWINLYFSLDERCCTHVLGLNQYLHASDSNILTCSWAWMKHTSWSYPCTTILTIEIPLQWIFN